MFPLIFDYHALAMWPLHFKLFAKKLMIWEEILRVIKRTYFLKGFQIHTYLNVFALCVHFHFGVLGVFVIVVVLFYPRNA